MTYCCRMNSDQSLTWCAHVHEDSKRSQPWQWLCTKHPRMTGNGFGFVTNHTWDNAPPFLFCKDVNQGACPLYEPDAGSQIKMEV